MPSDIVYLTALAGTCGPFFKLLGVRNSEGFIRFVQQIAGPKLRVAGDHRVLDAKEYEARGGRLDDALRAADVQRALVDDRIVCILAVRGGSWFTRILPRIDFSVLKRRKRPLLLVGFSEMTTLLNIAATSRNTYSLYDCGPAFLVYGMVRHASTVLQSRSARANPRKWMRARLREKVQDYLEDVLDILHVGTTRRRAVAKLVRGKLPAASSATFVGGTLSVMFTLLGTPYQSHIAPQGRWLVLEDINEQPTRLDRLLAQLTLADYWSRCKGVLLGDFHAEGRMLTRTVVRILDHHLPARRGLPVLVCKSVGHVWPCAPIPLHQPVKLRRDAMGRVHLNWSLPPVCART